MKFLWTEKERSKMYPSRMLWRENIAFRITKNKNYKKN